MLIQLLLVVFIIGLLISGPSFDNIWLTSAFYGGIFGFIVLAFWYSRRLSGGIADFLTGGAGGGKVNEALMRAERLEAQKDFRAAVEAYREAIAKDKKNPAIRPRVADLYYRLREYDKCLQYMHETLRTYKKMPMSERCALINRMADIYLQQKRDPSAAVEILSRIVSEYPESKYASYARERIAGIKKEF